MYMWVWKKTEDIHLGTETSLWLFCALLVSEPWHSCRCFPLAPADKPIQARQFQMQQKHKIQRIMQIHSANMLMMPALDLPHGRWGKRSSFTVDSIEVLELGQCKLTWTWDWGERFNVRWLNVSQIGTRLWTQSPKTIVDHRPSFKWPALQQHKTFCHQLQKQFWSQ